MKLTDDSVAKVEQGKPGRKEELLQTAVDRFSESGFQGTSIRDIAKTLGVSISQSS